MACFLLIFLGLNLAHAQDGVFQSFWQQIPESDATFFRTRGLEIDRLGNLYLTAADSNPDIIWQCVRKYDPFGILLWERVETNVTPQRSAIDGEQNLYVMGSVESESTDISLFKYDRKGDMEWHLSYDGPGRGEDVGQDLSIGPDQVVVTGSTTNGDGNLNLLVLAYDFDGNELWRFVHEGAWAVDDRGLAVVHGAGGHALVMGMVDLHHTVINIGPGGELIWLTDLESVLSDLEIAYISAAVDGGV